MQCIEKKQTEILNQRQHGIPLSCPPAHLIVRTVNLQYQVIDDFIKDILPNFNLSMYYKHENHLYTNLLDFTPYPRVKIQIQGFYKKRIEILSAGYCSRDGEYCADIHRIIAKYLGEKLFIHPMIRIILYRQWESCNPSKQIIILKQIDISPKATDARGNTPLHILMQNDYKQVDDDLEFYLERSDLFCMNNAKQIPYALATLENRPIIKNRMQVWLEKVAKILNKHTQLKDIDKIVMRFIFSTDLNSL